MQFVIGSAIYIAGAVLAYLFTSLGMHNGGPNAQQGHAFELPIYLSFIGVMMTTATVVLAALAIGISIVAIFTFRRVEREMQEIETRVEKKMTSGYVAEVINRVMFAGVELSQQESDNEEDTSSKKPDGD